MDLTSELAAVNRMLLAIGEQPINSLIPPQPPEAFIAQSTLREVSIDVQAEGFNFNTSYYPQLNAEIDGTVPLPNNTLQAKFPIQLYPDHRYQARGQRVYDVINRSYVINAQDLPLQALLVEALDWEELPEIAKSYIIYRASRIFSNRVTGSQLITQLTAQEEQQLRSRLRAWDMQLQQQSYLTGTRGYEFQTYRPSDAIGPSRRLP